jgi:hypothetical protein
MSSPSTDCRNATGRFAAGNPGGPGNPFARQTAALRAYLIAHVTERDIQDILDILLLNAKGGHLPTIKFLFSYVLGKPKPVVEPDTLDLQEMHMLQQSAQPPEALEDLCDQLPLDFQVQMTRFSQAANEVNSVQAARDAVAVDEKPPPAEAPAPPPQPRADSAAPSTDGCNGEPAITAPAKPPSTNGKTKHRPKLAGFDWLRELRRRPGGPPRA